MKKIFIILFIIAAIVIAGFVIKQRVGDIRPVFLPPIKTKPSQPVVKIKLGEPIDFTVNLADGYQIGYFAQELDEPRDIVFSPNGLLLVSLTGAGKVVALPDRNHDGIADEVDTLVAGLNRPHGIAFYNNKLYVAEETKVSRYLWSEGNLVGGIARLDKKLFDLPSGGRHFTRSIVFDKNGTMYISLGSTCDVCYEKNPLIASVLVSDAEGKTPKLFAKGLRNSVFITLNPNTNELWGTEMGRDFLGDNTPPDEINIIRSGNDYGWPICYGNKLHDATFDTKQYIRNPCLDTTAPVYEIPAHSAPLGLTFIDSSQFPADWQGDLLVAYHGSWNRSTPVGYKVVRLKVKGDSITGSQDFLSGFLQNGSAVARPVDLAFDPSGNLYISDDKSGTIFIVSKN